MPFRRQVMTLHILGWNAHWAAQQDALARPDTRPARVLQQARTRPLVHDGEAEIAAILPGRAHADPDAEWPVVGDWVAIRGGGADDLAVIEAVLPRRTAFARKVPGAVTREQVLVANLDVLFIVTGLDGDFNLRRLERFVSQAWASGATPVVLLNKADACDDVDGRQLAAELVAPGVDVLPLSARSGEGVDALAPYLAPGRTVALVGSSGVGKSTLVNRLLGYERMATGGVREDDSRGRHTTSHRELVPLPGGGLLIDTPGLREVQLWDAGDGIAHAFSEIEGLASGCRYRDCAHVHEPGCAVREAVESGGLAADRYESYLKLQREAAYLDARQEESTRQRERQQGKEMSQRIREIERYHPKRRGRDR